MFDLMSADDQNKKKSAPEVIEQTVVTSIEKLEGVDEEHRAYILFLAGPLQGKLHCLDTGLTSIGRSLEADISIQDTRISRKHVNITVDGGIATIKDNGSTNGTYVNGKRTNKQQLESGDKIQLSSSTILKFAYGDEGERMFHEEFYQMANYDAVTGVANKQAFIKRFKEEFSFARRNKLPLSLIMFDIDYFKKVNDTFGHMAGDFILREIAQKAKETVRDEDIIARYGGEEFAIILRGSTKDGATQLAERIRELIAAKPYLFEDKTIPVTISLGVATFENDNFASEDKLLAATDGNLYKSKENGRNQVTAD